MQRKEGGEGPGLRATPVMEAAWMRFDFPSVTCEGKESEKISGEAEKDLSQSEKGPNAEMANQKTGT
jgi:hypothetical protein